MFIEETAGGSSSLPVLLSSRGGCSTNGRWFDQWALAHVTPRPPTVSGRLKTASRAAVWPPIHRVIDLGVIQGYPK